MTGFATLHRQSLDHPLFDGDSSRLGAWTWLILRAAWKPTAFNIAGKTTVLERGQLCVSIRQLAVAWGWSKSAVDRFLARLETETMIVREAGHGRCILTICNYSKYQSLNDDDRDSSGTATGTAAGQQRDTKEQGNKGTIIPNGMNTTPHARGCRLPVDWEPTQLSAAVAKKVAGWPPGALADELESFRDWGASATGSNAVKKDWQGAWQNWLRRRHEEKYGKANGNGNRRSTGGSTADTAQRVRERFNIA